MKFNLLFSLLFLVSGCAAFSGGESHSPAELAEIQQVTNRYLAAFNDGDLDTLAGCWHLPGWASTGKGSHPLLDRSAAKTLYGDLLKKIRAEGFDHSELLSEEFEMVNKGYAFWRITFTRWDKDGNFMPPEVHGAVYTLLLKDGRWGITTLVLLADPVTEAITTQ